MPVSSTDFRHTLLRTAAVMVGLCAMMITGDVQAQTSSERTPASRVDVPSSNPSETDGGGEDKSETKPESAAADDRCVKFVEAYVRSASRKLFRALSGHDFNVREPKLDETLELEVGDSRRTFTVHEEENGEAVGLVAKDGEHRRTYVLISTNAGPVIASHRWPERGESNDDGETCRPSSSRIEYPSVSHDALDVEPFKFWGLRIVWRLPQKFQATATAEASDLEALLERIVNKSDSDSE